MMPPHDDIPERDAAGLREFGLVTAAMVAVLFGLFFPWLLGAKWPTWPWAIAGVLTAWAVLHPTSLNLVYHGWMRIGLGLGWVSSRIVLSILFYLILTPVGWLMRARGYDPLRRAFDRSASSYRKSSKLRQIQHMERPF